MIYCASTLFFEARVLAYKRYSGRFDDSWQQIQAQEKRAVLPEIQQKIQLEVVENPLPDKQKLHQDREQNRKE